MIFKPHKLQREGKTNVWRNKENIYLNVRTKGKAESGQVAQWKSNFQLDQKLENFREQVEDIEDGRLMIDCEIQLAVKKLGSWKEMRTGERLTYVQV